MRATLLVMNLATAVCLLATLGIELVPLAARCLPSPSTATRPAPEPVRRDVQAVHEAFPEAAPIAPAPVAPIPGPASRLYDGKTYAQWCEQLFTETNSAKRLVAVQALGTLGANGHGPAAARDLLEILKTCPPVPTAASDEARLIEALRQGLVRIGPDAEPVLLATLRDITVPDHCRRICAELLAATAHRAGEWVPALLAWMPTADLRSQQLARLALRGETPAAPELLSALAEALGKSDTTARLLLLDLFREIGSGTRDITPQLLNQLRSNEVPVSAATVTALEASGFFLAYEAGELADYRLAPAVVHDPALLPGYRTALDLARTNGLQESSTLAVLKLIRRMGAAAKGSAASVESLAAPSQPEAIRTAAREALDGLR